MYLLSKYSIPLMTQVGGGAIIYGSSDWKLVGGKMQLYLVQKITWSCFTL
jgi:hypothetical protein